MTIFIVMFCTAGFVSLVVSWLRASARRQDEIIERYEYTIAYLRQREETLDKLLRKLEKEKSGWNSYTPLHNPNDLR